MSDSSKVEMVMQQANTGAFCTVRCMVGFNDEDGYFVAHHPRCGWKEKVADILNISLYDSDKS